MDDEFKQFMSETAILAYLKDLYSKKDGLLLDIQKCNKFIKLVDFCKSLCKSHNCRIYKCNVEKELLHASIEIIFNGEWEVDKKTMLKITDVCDGINVTTALDDESVLVTFFVTHMWTNAIKKS